MRWKHQFRETQPMLWIQERPCGTCGLSPGPKGGRDMHAHSLAVAADTRQESSAATGSSILAAGEIPCQLPARQSCCLCLLWCVKSLYALNLRESVQEPFLQGADSGIGRQQVSPGALFYTFWPCCLSSSSSWDRSMHIEQGWAAGMVPQAGWGFPSSQHIGD